MRFPTLRGVIDRRILVNFRVDQQVLSRVLPAPFRPRLVHGAGLAGICLIRLKHIRPRWLPHVGLASENAAHRIAVEWEQNGRWRQGVYIPRRDTSSRLATLAGGRLFPGEHHHARFNVAEHYGRYCVEMASDDGEARLKIEGRVVDHLPADSAFGSLGEASDFFKFGSLGYSVTSEPGVFDGLELRTLNWAVQPMAVEGVESSFFGDVRSFPAGSVEFDSALLMQGIEHEWLSRESLCSWAMS
jgi:hypothetical protein